MLASELDTQIQLDEEPFIAQLCLRSKLLNDPFRKRVIEILSGNAVTSRRPIAPKRFSQSASLRSMNHSHASEAGLLPVEIMECMFDEGPRLVEVHAAPIKTAARMREKLLEYGNPKYGGVWPFAANILDPIRVSVVCEGASQILQVLSWFRSINSMPVCRIKNKFTKSENSTTSSEGSQGYRDLKVFVLMEGFGSLRIIGEIQVIYKHLNTLLLFFHTLSSQFKQDSFQTERIRVLTFACCDGVACEIYRFMTEFSSTSSTKPISCTKSSEPKESMRCRFAGLITSMELGIWQYSMFPK